MSTHTITRPADEGLPLPKDEGFEQMAITCAVCLLTFQVWKWEGADVILEHWGNGDAHIERHGPRPARRGGQVMCPNENCLGYYILVDDDGECLCLECFWVFWVEEA